MEELILLIFWPLLALVITTGIAAAEGRNRNPVAWMLIAVVLTPPAALILLAFMPRLPSNRPGALHKIRTAGLQDA